MSQPGLVPNCSLTVFPMKRTKAYESSAEVRPTIRNKPSGLIDTWYDVAVTPSPRQTLPPPHNYMYDPSRPHPAPQLHDQTYFPSLSPPSQSPPIPAQITKTLPQQFHTSADPTTLTLPSVQHRSPFVLPTTSENSFWVPPISPTLRQENMPVRPPIMPPLRQEGMQVRSPSFIPPLLNNDHQVACLPHPYVGEDGVKSAVGIQDLPDTIRPHFHDKFIQ